MCGAHHPRSTQSKERSGSSTDVSRGKRQTGGSRRPRCSASIIAGAWCHARPRWRAACYIEPVSVASRPRERVSAAGLGLSLGCLALPVRLCCMLQRAVLLLVRRAGGGARGRLIARLALLTALPSPASTRGRHLNAALWRTQMSIAFLVTVLPRAPAGHLTREETRKGPLSRVFISGSHE